MQFVAGSEIVLLPGFSSGDNFVARIEGCRPELRIMEMDSLTGRTTAVSNHSNASLQLETDDDMLSGGEVDTRNEQRQQETIEVYPNPTSSGVMLTAPLGAKITVLDLGGKSVFKGSKEYEGQIIEMAHLPPGIYLFQVSYRDEKLSRRVVLTSPR